MGILRADRITGLGGANAITGSTFFSTEKQSLTFDGSDINFDTGDFTVEAFVFHIGGSDDTIISDVNGWTFTYGASGNLRFYMASGSNVVDATSSFISNEWVHVAVVRSSGTLTFYQNGTAVGSHSYSHDISNNSSTTYIGKYHSGDVQNFIGHISNLRVIQGTALYTGAFTPPTSRLEKTSDTVLLTCNSAGNVLNEETGKFLMNENPNSPTEPLQLGPIATRFTPNSPVGFSTTTDVGTQFGSTFDGVTTFDSQAYMVVPGGNTRERNRGRGLIFGGYSPNPAAHVSTIQSIEIQSFGNAQDFGDLSSIRSQMGAVSSSTRAVSCGGGNDTPSDYTDTNTCEFVTIANSSNTTDFGDLSVSRQPYKGCSNDTRGIIFGGYIHPANSNTIDFITIATTGNATDFGDEIDTNRAGASCSSTTRGIVAGGYPATNRISFVEIATTGNAQDFGDLLNSVVAPSGCSNKTRGVFAGGSTPTAINVIQFITMSSAGDATDFGDLNTTEKVGSKGNSNLIRGIFSGGYDGGTFVNSISAITIATTGNAGDFGDISGTLRFASAVSDSHGGLE